MATFPQLERLFWFDGELKRKQFPSASHLAAELEISHKTAQRDVTFYRDRLLAPIAYDSARKGYYYTEGGFEVPRLPATQEELLTLLIARRLLTTSAGIGASSTLPASKSSISIVKRSRPGLAGNGHPCWMPSSASSRAPRRFR